MFVRLAVLLVGTVLVTVIAFRVYLRVVLPLLKHRQHEQTMRDIHEREEEIAAWDRVNRTGGKN